MKCKACSAEIVFLPTGREKPDGKPVHEPVNASSLSEEDLRLLAARKTVTFNWSRHISHFSNCPGAKHFRKPKNQMELL